MHTTDCIKWKRWGVKRSPNDPEYLPRLQRAAGEDILHPLVNALPPRPPRKQRPRQNTGPKNLADEKGKRRNVLGRNDVSDMSSALSRKGQVVSLRNGGCRVDWEDSTQPEEFPPSTGPEAELSFTSQLRQGMVAYATVPSSSRDSAMSAAAASAGVSSESVVNTTAAPSVAPSAVPASSRWKKGKQTKKHKGTTRRKRRTSGDFDSSDESVSLGSGSDSDEPSVSHDDESDNGDDEHNSVENDSEDSHCDDASSIVKSDIAEEVDLCSSEDSDKERPRWCTMRRREVRTGLGNAQDCVGMRFGKQKRKKNKGVSLTHLGHCEKFCL